MVGGLTSQTICIDSIIYKYIYIGGCSHQSNVICIDSVTASRILHHFFLLWILQRSCHQLDAYILCQWLISFDPSHV